MAGLGHDERDADLEPTLARVLQVGTYASIGLVLVGTILLLAAGISPLAASPPLQVDQLVPDILAARPSGFLWLGILGICATPALRVASAAIGFWRRGEQRMVAVALLILVIVAAGVITGLLTG